MNNSKPKRIITDPITNLKAHVEFLGRPTPRDPARDGYDMEFRYLEDQSRKEETTQRFTSPPETIDKNRYTNVKPPDFSRVPLKEIPGVAGSDYINANFIKGFDGQPNVYISTQGPLEHTKTDFWRMTWEHGIYVILMLTKEYESGKGKSAQYWPEWNGSPNPIEYGRIRVTIVSKKEPAKDIITRNFTIENLDTNEKREAVQLQYTGWLDHQAPPSVKSFMNMLHLVDENNSTALKSSTTGIPPSICVHCSAGIGRSGTFCAIHILFNFMKKHFETSCTTPPLNVVNTILEMRRQRPGMVQTKEQYVFIYSVIYEEYKKMKKEAEKKFKSNGSVPSTETSTTTASTTTTPSTTTSTNTTTSTPSTNSTTPLTPVPSNGQSDLQGFNTSLRLDNDGEIAVGSDV